MIVTECPGCQAKLYRAPKPLPVFYDGTRGLIIICPVCKHRISLERNDNG